MNTEWQETADDFSKAFKDVKQTGLRWSYLVIAGMAVAGGIVNLFLPRGWVVWPLVLVAGIMLMIHEAAERNNDGVPPFHAYAFFICLLLFWGLFAALMSILGPLLLIVGSPFVIYYCIKVYKQYKKRMKLIEFRVQSGLCVHCGEKFNPKKAACHVCGQNPVGDGSRLLKMEDVAPRTKEQVARSRHVIKGEMPTIAARRREQALLQRNTRRASSAKPKG